MNMTTVYQTLSWFHCGSGQTSPPNLIFNITAQAQRQPSQ